MEQFLYRFRTAEKLLDSRYQELDKQEIYFAPPEELNDPVEGYKDIFWSGDEIVWKNLLRHYLLSLKLALEITLIAGVDRPADPSTLPLFMTDNDLPEPARARYREASTLFLGQEEVAKFPQLLASGVNPVRRNELSFYLMYVHRFALSAIFRVDKKYRLLGSMEETFVETIISNESGSDIRSCIPSVNEWEIANPNLPDATEQLFAATVHANQQAQLISKYNNPGYKEKIGILAVLAAYPEIYLRQISHLIHGRWYTACFMGNCSNPSVWSHYGDGHKGICLKFRTCAVETQPSINLHGITGWGGSAGKITARYGDRNHTFHEVNYSKRYPEIDFFRSLGRVPIPALSAFWYSDEHKNRSVCMTDMFKDEEQWRKSYWSTFFASITTKLDAWAYEDEYRLIINGLMSDYSEKETRKLRYKFGDLEGIIYGINTTDDVKLRIAKIIENKCRAEARRDFKFYQSYYARHAGEIGVAEMAFLKFD